MKVTVKAKPKPKQCEIPFDEIPVGSVYEISNGAVLFKVTPTDAVVFKGDSGSDYFSMACGYKSYLATKILGKLTEIIVEEV